MVISSKTKLMHVNSHSTLQTGLQLRDFQVDPVTCFTYLGSVVNTDLNIATTIRERLAKAASVFAMLKRMWTADRLPLKLKVMLHDTLVRPVALYGAETWTLLPSHEAILDVEEMSWLRQITKVSRRQQISNENIRRRVNCLVPLRQKNVKI